MCRYSLKASAVAVGFNIRNEFYPFNSNKQKVEIESVFLRNTHTKKHSVLRNTLQIRKQDPLWKMWD